MLEVLLSQNCFDFDQSPSDTIEFLTTHFPKGRLGFIRQIQLRLSDHEIRFWDQEDRLDKWTRLITLIRDNFCLERLSITVIADSFDCGAYAGDEPEDARFVYDVYCAVTHILQQLRGLEDIHFDLDFFNNLAPVMRRVVLGQQHPKILSEPAAPPETRNRIPFGHKIPAWYQESDFVRN